MYERVSLEGAEIADLSVINVNELAIIIAR